MFPLYLLGIFLDKFIFLFFKILSMYLQILTPG